MKSYVITGLVCLALGVLGGALGYKRLHPPKACPQLTEQKQEAETRTIIRYVDKKGQPVIKEMVVTNKSETVNKPLPPLPLPKYSVGVSGQIDTKGVVKLGPTFGQNITPNIHVTGGVIVNPRGKPEPAIIGGVLIRF